MNVRDVTIVLRLRSGWEAVDLGLVLTRRYFRDLFRIGLLGFGPMLLLLTLLCWRIPLLLPFLLFWGKPLLDRFYLFYLSRRIFGQEVTVKDTLREWKRLMLRGSFSLLTWRRFSFFRGMTMAVSDLEQLTGAARGRRCSAITREGGGYAFLILLGGLLLELLGGVTLLILAWLFIPQGQSMEWEVWQFWLWQDGLAQTLLILSFGVYYGVLVFLLEPLYLASGFALYLNSRTSQEAWDIELRFRELAARVAHKKIHLGEHSKKALAVLVGVWIVFGFGNASMLEASTMDPEQAIEEVLSHEDFTNHVERYRKWVPKEGGWLERLKNWFEELKRGFSAESRSIDSVGLGVDGLFKIVGILALTLLGAFLIVLLVNYLSARRNLTIKSSGKKTRKPPPQVVLGMELAPESLPEDLLAQARLYWGKGEARLAMSLLYRGALSSLVHEQEVAIESSDTEYECVAQVKSDASKRLSDYFEHLSRYWVMVAYSEEEVEGQSFEQLCQTWPFGRRKG